jgi:hypothetical protein
MEKEMGVDDAARQRERYRKLTEESILRRRQRHREWAAAKRRKEGIPARKFKVPRTSGSKRLPTEPIAQFIESRPEGRTEMAEMTGIEERRLYAIQRREYKTTELEIIDAILVGLDANGVMNDLYPVEDRPVGWGVLDPEGVLEDYCEQNAA